MIISAASKILSPAKVFFEFFAQIRLLLDGLQPKTLY